jgi:hypothetical protein
VAKYLIRGTYCTEFEIDTELVGKELFHHYANMLNSKEIKEKVCLMSGTMFNICACGKGYPEKYHDAFCSRCGRKLTGDGGE